MKDSEILYQLHRLVEAFPQDKCDVWLVQQPGRELKFTAYLSSRDELPCVFGNGSDLAAAVDDAIRQGAGKRGQENAIAAKQQKIDAMRAELAKLEQEVEPVMAAIALERIKHENP